MDNDPHNLHSPHVNLLNFPYLSFKPWGLEINENNPRLIWSTIRIELFPPYFKKIYFRERDRESKGASRGRGKG